MDIVLNHNIATKHWWGMPSLQQESAVIQLHCDYYFEDKFRCKLDKKDESRLFIFHLNVKSIPKHYNEMES